MKQVERMSIMRIFADLILADSIIDNREIDAYVDFKKKYSISKEDEILASEITLSEAIRYLRESDLGLQKDLIGDFNELVLSDGFCDKKEALIVLSLLYCFDDLSRDYASVISVKVSEINLEDSQVLYVESKYDSDINKTIAKNYRQISQEFRLAMFDFVYIPFVAKHFASLQKEQLSDMIQLIAPKFGEEFMSDMINKLLNTTTIAFCKEQLCNKLGIRSLYATDPGFMIKIGDSQVNGSRMANYLKIDIVGDVVTMVRSFVDRYIELLSSDSIIISNPKKSNGRFVYSGFYKHVFDIYMLQKEIRSTLLIDMIKESISLPELNETLSSLHRKEKAMYLLFLIEMGNGGINFSLPQTAQQLDKYNKRMALLQAKYDIIYSNIGGAGSKAPDITNEKIRRPMLSCIKKAFTDLGARLHNAEDYTVQRTVTGVYTLYVPKQSVFYYDYKEGKRVSLFDSELYKEVMNVR